MQVSEARPAASTGVAAAPCELQGKQQMSSSWSLGPFSAITPRQPVLLLGQRSWGSESFAPSAGRLHLVMSSSLRTSLGKPSPLKSQPNKDLACILATSQLPDLLW